MSNVILRLRRFLPRKSVVALICAVMLCASVFAEKNMKLIGQVAIFGTTAPTVPAGYPVLDSCPGSTKIFPADKSTEDWGLLYHKTVSDIIMGHQTIPKPADCRSQDADAGDTDETKLPSITLTPVTSKPAPKPAPQTSLKDIAEQLAPWQKPADLANLSEWDMDSVLLELLRVYECALQQRERGLVSYLQDQMAHASSSSSTPGVIPGMLDIPQFTLDAYDEEQRIDIELKTARPALRRTLTAVAGQSQIQFLVEPLDCLERASFDIRNELGLAATASSCLPRVWNARGGERSL